MMFGDPFLARVEEVDDEMKGRGNSGPHLIELAPSQKDLLALITLDLARLGKAGQSCSNINSFENFGVSLDTMRQAWDYLHRFRFNHECPIDIALAFFYCFHNFNIPSPRQVYRSSNVCDIAAIPLT